MRVDIVPSETSGMVAVTLTRIPGELRLTVADDGQGADPQQANSGLGGRLVDPLRASSAARSNGRAATRERCVSLTLPSRDAS